MPAIINEQQQWLDAAGKPLVGGFVYIGEQGADPKVSPEPIFADREFQTPIANPQVIDANGRTSQKVWVRGRYSILVEDLNNVQQYQELDNGEPEGVGLVTLDNIQGATDISASGTPTVTAYVDKEIYTGKTVSTNGTPVTLNIDEVGARPIRFPDGVELPVGQWLADQIFQVAYNATSDSFVFLQQQTMTQAEAEAGTDTEYKLVTAERIAQAIAAQETTVPEATQAEVEQELPVAAYIPPDLGKVLPGVALHHVTFDGNAATPDSTKTGYNVGTIVDNGAGSYTVPFSPTPLGSANFTAVVNGGNTGSDVQILFVAVVDKTTTNYRVDVESDTSVQTDSYVDVSVWGVV